MTTEAARNVVYDLQDQELLLLDDRFTLQLTKKSKDLLSVPGN